MRLLKPLFVPAILCFFALPAHARPIHTNDHFSITVPDDWVQLSAAELHSYSSAVNSLAPKLDADLNYVLQPAQNQPFTYPYVTIIVKHKSGVIPSPQVIVDQMNKEKNGAAKDVEGDANGIVSDLQVSDAWYDETHDIVRMKGRMSVANIENVFGIVGIKLFKGGYIQINCYAPASDIKSYASLYEDILASVTVDPGWEPGGIIDLKVLTGGNSKVTIWVFFGFAGLIAFGFWNTRRSKSGSSTVSNKEATPSAAQQRPATVIMSLDQDPELVLTDKIYTLLNESEGVMKAYLFNYRQSTGTVQPTLGIKFEDSISLKNRQMQWQKIKRFCETQANLGVLGLTADHIPEVSRSGVSVFPNAWDPGEEAEAEERPSLALEV